MNDHFIVTWIDSGAEPECAPDPNYPNGRDLAPEGLVLGCKVKLRYPAKRCGKYLVRCTKCGCTTVVTTAGRPDDPRSVVAECITLGAA